MTFSVFIIGFESMRRHTKHRRNNITQKNIEKRVICSSITLAVDTHTHIQVVIGNTVQLGLKHAIIKPDISD